MRLNLARYAGLTVPEQYFPEFIEVMIQQTLIYRIRIIYGFLLDV